MDEPTVVRVVVSHLLGRGGIRATAPDHGWACEVVGGPPWELTLRMWVAEELCTTLDRVVVSMEAGPDIPAKRGDRPPGW